MTSTRKESVKTLKGPDQFQVKVMSALDWAARHAKVIAAVVAPLLLVAAGMLGWRYVQDQQKLGRLEEVGKVQALYDQELRAVAKERDVLQTRVEAIDAQMATAAENFDPKLTADKQALQTQIDAMKPDHSGSLAKFKEYFSQNPGYSEGWMAGVTAADILLDQEQYAEARTLLETVLKESHQGSGSAYYQTAARSMLVSVLEQQGEFDQALVEIAALEKSATSDMKPRVLLTKGRLLMLKGSTEDAKASFNSLIDAHGNAPEAQKARSMLALLN